MSTPRKIAVILGVGPGLATAVASSLSPTHSLLLLSRSLPTSLPNLNLPASIPKENILALPSDGSVGSLRKALEEMEKKWPEGKLDVGVYNVNQRFNLKSFLDSSIEDLQGGLDSGVVNGWNFAQALIPRFLKNPDPRSLSASDPASREGKGTLIFTGATMSLRAGASFSSLAPGMFARRALSQSLAREFGPQGIHVAHVVIDGIIDTGAVKDKLGEDKQGSRMQTEEIADAFVGLVRQRRSAWTQELDLRPDVEKW
ncbi:hypothetical protein L202_03608 [Cryptococcus amylolentus CBS 6039]|uniref:Short-chain dehydrogenase n=2 Tax=Cryptococcus amylolentus TaxID=104669 RepID=A0A1E3HTK3_9TREE|nr:hypothetical protein L202_03608 [Cryptococcus amylolentus CBS 6039]ODN79677.1 hypothetical protein L202_03608 [Cryptococcus amylolentus CBS 6039]ODO07984.1 hypothetical protein I350_03567 [Cryptococcus amylolentus CBS 6273]